MCKLAVGWLREGGGNLQLIKSFAFKEINREKMAQPPDNAADPSLGYNAQRGMGAAGHRWGKKTPARQPVTIPERQEGLAE